MERILFGICDDAWLDVLSLIGPWAIVSVHAQGAGQDQASRLAMKVFTQPGCTTNNVDECICKLGLANQDPDLNSR